MSSFFNEALDCLKNELMISESRRPVQVAGADIFKILNQRFGFNAQEIMSIVGELMARKLIYSPKLGHFKLSSICENHDSLSTTQEAEP